MFSLIALIVAIVAIVWSYHEKDQIARLEARVGFLEEKADKEREA